MLIRVLAATNCGGAVANRCEIFDNGAMNGDMVRNNERDQEAGAFSAFEITGAFNAAIEQEVVRKQAKGLPVARYDAESGRAYLENMDGAREYV